MLSRPGAAYNMARRGWRCLLAPVSRRGLAIGEPCVDLEKSFAYCVHQVRTYDYENYVWCVQLDKALRPAIIALRAFNAETALVSERVQKGGSMLLQMRFKWWEDAINAMYNGTPPDHPVIQALGHVLKSRHLTRYRMRRIVTTRQKDALQLEAPADLASLEQYANGTAVQLLLLQLEANGVGNLETEKAAALVGHAVGMTNLLRGTIHHAQRGRVYLPRDLCDQHQVIHADILRGKDSEGVRRVAEAVSKAAEENIKKARDLMPAIPLEARPLFLPAVGCALFLSALKARAYNVFDPMWTKSGVSPLWLQLNLKYHLVRGSF